MGRKVIVDSDTASDDTIAILLASRLFDLLGVTIVAGNVKYQDQVRNALFTLEYIGKKDVPVYLGQDRPILNKWRTVEEVHGKHGMGEWDIPEPTKRPEKENAIDAIIRLARENQGELEILAISPLTNLALAYLREHSITKWIRKVWIMGGAFTRGNTTPIAEFNFWVDPEAAKVVLDAGFDVTIVPWETTEEYGTLDLAKWERIRSMNTALSRFFERVNKTLLEFSLKQGNRGSVHPDSLTTYLAFDGSAILEQRKFKVDVELCSLSRGAMLVDWYSKGGENANVVLKADSEKFYEKLTSILSSS
ncbi:Pyrimidine-specific ribonucleoside hydrolase RihA [Metallosphaera sp. J1]|uniref:nucleoside hydrolase n=1 Tax=Metallosphaera TaxID=41980 RepID=UPI001EDF1EEF|nr:nucleoside hydrolase [Metallosphaera javensis (ex Hofmann et al. 2022)]MCG3109228.1 Pyrimidine-specific ribonucleoside hydrolase RihA [Metallosphaera javensis (ex Hofmann et al. 2022)]BCS92932.1 MAG: pyrimidine-specific ribonucleoside hydrolase RihA [Metallosphaera javensis (ex Sakai et al. 2022)]